MTVAVRTPNTIGVSSWICFLPMTLSTRYFHAFLRFSLLPGDFGAVSLAMIGGKKYTPAIRCLVRPYVYIANKSEGGAIFNRPLCPPEARWPWRADRDSKRSR